MSTTASSDSSGSVTSSGFSGSSGSATSPGAPRTGPPRPEGGAAPLRAAAALARRLSGRRDGLWQPGPLALFALLSAAVRIPSFLRLYWSPDEGFLATEARALLHGGHLYATVVDRKPPLLPWLYETVFACTGGGSLWPVRVLAVVATTVTAVFVAGIARQRWGPREALAAGTLFVLVSTGLAGSDAQAATFEVFMLPGTAAAVYFALRGEPGRAGVATALAFLTKQQGALVLPAVLWCVWRSGAPGRYDGGGHDVGGHGARREGGRVARLTRLGAGLLLPVALCMAVSGPRGFLFWVVGSSGSYATSGGAPLTMLARGGGNLLVMAAACLGLVVPLLAAAWRDPRSSAVLWLWLGGSALAVVAGLHFFGHYYLQLLPSIVLLGVEGMVRAGGGRRRRVLLLPLVYTACACLAFTVWAALSHPDGERHAVAVAKSVRSHTHSGQRVFVWGMHPEVYWLSGRTPASKYLTAGFLSNFGGGVSAGDVGMRHAVPGSWRAFEREMASPPAVIVDDSASRGYPVRDYGPLRKLLDTRYRRFLVRDGAVFYRRTDLRAAARPAPAGGERHAPGGRRAPVSRRAASAPGRGSR